MSSTPPSISRLLGAVAASVPMFGMLGVAQSPDDLAWQRFLGWLEVAPPANGPLEILQGYQASLAAQGRAPADAGREMGIVMRLMRERNDAWPLMFDRIYGPGSIADPGYVARLHRALEPGGVVVVESFASDRSAAQRRPVDIDPADLRRAFSAFKMLRFEDAPAVSDWDPQTTRLVRMVAQKAP